MISVLIHEKHSYAVELFVKKSNRNKKKENVIWEREC